MKPVLAIWMLLLLSACRSEALTFSVAYQSAKCTGVAEGTTLIRNQSELESMFSPLLSSREPLPQIDFDTQMAVLLSMGMKPNAAYRFELMSYTGHVIDDVLVLPVRELGPEPGKMYAQMITSPCLLLTLERVAAVRSVQLSVEAR